LPEVQLWRERVYGEIRARMRLQGTLSVERMCQLTQVSRAGFYRYLRRGWQTEEEMALRSTVQLIVIEHWWRYGYRRVTAALRSQGMTVNHKRIARASSSSTASVSRSTCNWLNELSGQ